MAGLSNADFRALLATPRPGAGGGSGGGGGGAGGVGEQKKKHKKPGGGKPGAGKPGGKPGAGKDAEAEEEDEYRDRAAERRKGLSVDFEGVPDDLVGLLEGKGDLRGVSYEDSKYLGGDVAHTHLVKGLDFALLQKVRAEQEAKKRAGGGGSDDEEGGQAALAKTVAVQAQQQPVTFQTSMGRTVHAFFFDPKHQGAGVPVAELFLPRRTAFVYELEDPEAPDVPTTLRRSKEDCPKVQETAMGVLDHSVLGKIAKIMSYMTLQGGGKKKLKRRERDALLQQHGIQLQGAMKHPGGHGGMAAGGGSQDAEGQAQRVAAAPLPPQPADEDDDIFGDVGTDYQPTIKDKKRAAAAAAAAAEGEQRRGGYFGGAGEDLHGDLPPLPADDDLPPPPPPEDGELVGPAPGPSRPPAGFDAAAAYAPYPEADVYPVAAEEALGAEARAEKHKDKRRAADLLQQGGDDDAYAECYPSYYDYGTNLADSDEEGAHAGDEQPQALTRRDFGTDADFEEYQASGMAPRQAEGRSKVRTQQKEAGKEQNKLANQLGKIQKIMEEKGYEHTEAFIKPEGDRRQRRQREEGAGGGGGGNIGKASGGAGGFGTKKRRI